MAYDYDRDFVKVPRGIARALATDPLGLQVYMAIALRVRWETGREIGKRGEVRDLQPGQAVVGRDDLATVCAASSSSIRRTVIRLQQLGILDIKADSRGTVVTLRGYRGTEDTRTAGGPAGGQVFGQQVGQQADSKRTAGEPLTRSEKEEERRERESRPPSPPEPDQLERERAARAHVRRKALAALNDLREQVGIELRQHVRPLHMQDPGERALADRQREGASEADIAHVLAVAGAEARTEGTVKWLTGSLFEERQWRRMLGMTLEDARRAGPKPTAPVRIVMPDRDDDLPPVSAAYGAERPKRIVWGKS